MIQRIQTIYLFFTFCLMAIPVFVPFSSSWTVSLGSGIIAVLAIITIFLYKNRSLQIKIGYTMLLLLVLVYALYFIFDPRGLLITENFRQIRFTFVFPLISGILVYLAVRRIQKDEKLVRSLDRLR